MSSCNMKCSGNQAETCGGPNALLVFYSGVAPQAPPAGPTVLQAYGIWNYLGCYTDQVAARTLLTGVPVQGGPVTPQRCMDACQSAATPFKYAGVEYAGVSFMLLYLDLHPLIYVPNSNAVNPFHPRGCRTPYLHRHFHSLWGCSL